MYNYIYIMSIGGKVTYSYESSDSLLERVSKEDRPLVDMFINSSKPGEFIVLSDGDIISHVE